MIRTVWLLALIFATTSLTLFKVSQAESGRLIEFKRIIHYSKKYLELSKRLLGTPIPSSRSGATGYKVIYETTDLEGKPTIASGLVLFPDSETARVKPLPILSFQHGTVTKRDDVPSRAQLNLESSAAAIIYGSMEYIVTAADYLGLGDSSIKFHPYLHAKTEATASRDLIIALQTIINKIDYKSNGQLFLAGYSQGGHATLALHREIQNNPVPGLNVTACTPMAGPYDLSESGFKDILAKPASKSSLYAAYILNMLIHIYPSKMPKLKDIVGEKLAMAIPRLFDGSHSMEQILRELPPEPKELFLPNAMTSLLSDPHHSRQGIFEGVLGALTDNNVYDWKPSAPILLLHGQDDKDVSFSNAKKAHAVMRAHGAQIELVNLGSDKTHASSVVPAFLLSLKFFESFR